VNNQKPGFLFFPFFNSLKFREIIVNMETGKRKTAKDLQIYGDPKYRQFTIKV
jgi:hypothetical protein